MYLTMSHHVALHFSVERFPCTDVVVVISCGMSCFDKVGQIAIYFHVLANALKQKRNKTACHACSVESACCGLFMPSCRKLAGITLWSLRLISHPDSASSNRFCSFFTRHALVLVTMLKWRLRLRRCCCCISPSGKSMSARAYNTATTISVRLSSVDHKRAVLSVSFYTLRRSQ